MKWKEHKVALFGVLGYLILFIWALVWGYTLTRTSSLTWITENAFPIRMSICGGVGGSIYLLRAVYLRSCVHNDWDGGWLPWYIIRPIASVLCGFVSYLFLSAGLIVLDASKAEGSTEFGFYALALLAGLNVDRFLVRVEEVGKSVFGIEGSRASRTSEDDDAKEKK